MTSLPALPDGLRAAEVRVVSGGPTGSVWRATLTDGRRVIVKRCPAPAELEAEGLEALASAGAPTPAVIAVAGDVLVLEHVEGPGDLESLGRALALAHGAVGDAFGWHRSNVIGPLPQDNTPDLDWARFHLERRIAPHLDAVPSAIRRRIESRRAHLAELLTHGAPASLVHGDLWSGNIVGGRWLIDPAVHRADREVDLAMLDLFGGVPAGFLAGYEDVWPLDDGWEQRRPALQLYPLLVHVHLFGAAYLGPLDRALARAGV